MIPKGIFTKEPIIKVRYIGHSYGLIKNEIYIVTSRFYRKRRVRPGEKIIEYTGFKLLDGDGDVFEIHEHELGKEFELVEGTLVEY